MRRDTISKAVVVRSRMELRASKPMKKKRLEKIREVETDIDEYLSEEQQMWEEYVRDYNSFDDFDTGYQSDEED